MGGGGLDLIQTKQKRAAREQRNKYKPRTETRTTRSNQTRRQAGGLNCLHILHKLFCSIREEEPAMLDIAHWQRIQIIERSHTRNEGC